MVIQDPWRKYFPTKWLFVLMAIGVIDLISTAALHAGGHIQEMNPLMKPIIEQSEWLFVLVKGMTLVLGYLVIMRHAKTHRRFVADVCRYGSIAYLLVWSVWFVAAL